MNYFDGERLREKIEEKDSNERLTNEEINEKYIKGEVRIVTEQGRFQLTTIESIVEGEDYKLNPEFQRRHRWSVEKKSKLIESFIMNVPIPPIFLYEVDFSVYEVMDGLQRLTAIYQFYKGGFALTGLEEWSELNGLRYTQLPLQVKKGIDRRYLSSMILLKETAKTSLEAERLKQLVFERINSGGEHLEPQETRNALYNGSLNKLCINLSRDVNFCKMWGIPSPTKEELETNEISPELAENILFKKMGDVELVLRFFAFRHLDKWEKMNLEDFLDYFLREGNLLDQSILESYKILFTETNKLVYDLFGMKAFCLYRERSGEWKWYDRPTKVVYDAIMYVMSQNLHNREFLLSRKEDINVKIQELYRKYYDEFEGRNTGRNNVIARINVINDFIDKYIEEKQ
ncbi:hypothetical protein BSK63_23600 [Paenibacillus odorifer]|uniref:DUF262 domain-containing protein n=1 Tax=Paenibacillus odorifer TaxID=189426 RepID=UPI00096CD6AA|nr:DUF262 domain-containing protein [Paenibacillus odorifer]OME28899.1 hypothetical protein BSK63_23600 [Paenibacillus odorifer]